VQEAQPSVPKETGVNKDGRQFRTATEMADKSSTHFEPLTAFLSAVL
jgi:hypothetical protein